MHFLTLTNSDWQWKLLSCTITLCLGALNYRFLSFSLAESNQAFQKKWFSICWKLLVRKVCSIEKSSIAIWSLHTKSHMYCSTNILSILIQFWNTGLLNGIMSFDIKKHLSLSPLLCSLVLRDWITKQYKICFQYFLLPRSCNQFGAMVKASS